MDEVRFLLAHLASQAPETIPSWFHPEPPTSRPVAPALAPHLERIFGVDVMKWKCDPENTRPSLLCATLSTKKEMGEFEDAWEAYVVGQDAWENATQEARYFAWRRHFAARIFSEVD